MRCSKHGPAKLGMGQGEAVREGGRSLSDRERSATRFRLAFLVVLAGFTVGVTVAALRVEPFGTTVRPDGSERLVDFPSHRAFACAAWSGDSLRGGATSIYSLDAHLRATEAWTHRPGHIALPFAYSPTMLWVLGPMCLVPARVAFILWSLAGLVAMAAVASRARLPWTAMLPLATPIALYTQALGQTALLSTAGLLWLMTEDRGGWIHRSPWASGTLLWLFTAKPPLAVTAMLPFLARRGWRPILVAAGLTVVSTVTLIPWLGPGWLHDYAALLRQYDRIRLPPEFAWSVVPETMSNLRAALSVDLGIRDDVAVAVSNGAWAVALAGIAAVAWRRSLEWSRVWSLAVLAYLLLCPHVSATENIALCCVLAVIGIPRGARAVVAVSIVVIGLWLAPVSGTPPVRRPSMLFFAMLGVSGLLLRDGRLGRPEPLV